MPNSDELALEFRAGRSGSKEHSSYNNPSEVGVPTYQPGDYVKVEFPDEATGIAEWLWMRVKHCDDQKELVFGTLDNAPLNDYGDKVVLGSELAVSYSKIRDHKKATEFTKQ